MSPRDLSFRNVVLLLQFLVMSNWSKQWSHMIHMNNCEGALVESLVRTICMKKDNLRTITLILDFFL